MITISEERLREIIQEEITNRRESDDQLHVQVMLTVTDNAMAAFVRKAAGLTPR